MKSIYKMAVVIMLSGLLSGCLVTRGEIRQAVAPVPPTNQQIQQANEVNQMDQIDSEIRHLRGRVGDLENSVNTMQTNHASDLSTLDSRVTTIEGNDKVYESELTKLDTEYMQLQQEIEALRTSYDKLSKQRRFEPRRPNLNVIVEARQSFAEKKWQQAIVEFQKYRQIYPHGLHYAEATYKIGFSFSKLGMKSDAKTFYAEVAQKYPKTLWGKRAAEKLKALK